MSVEQLKSNHDAALSQWRLEVERTRFEAERAERRYRSVDPENRRVARGLEAEWETRLRAVADAETELHKREQQRPATLGPAQLEALQGLGGAIPTLNVPVPRFKPMGQRTDEDTISLLPRLAALYPDEVIAGIFNRQGRKTATGERFTANQVGSLRRYRGHTAIPAGGL